MKKKLTALLAGLFVAFSLAGCGFIPSNPSSQASSEASVSTESTVSSSSTQEASTESGTASSVESSTEASTESGTASSTESSTEASTESSTASSTESSVETSVESSAVEPAYKDYTSFTAKEKTLFNEYFSEVIPFIPNNEYYVEEYSFVYEEYGMTETGINFYTVGNTEEEFESYKEALDRKYELESSEEDEYGDMWYYYNAEEFYIDVSYYYYEGDYIVDVYAYVLVGAADDSSTDSSTDSSDDSSDDMVDGDFGEILLTLYGLKDGESVTGEFTLTGKIISLDDYNNPTIEVEGFEDMPVYCYRLQLPDASIGDIITVTATTMKNYQGTYEFMNCTLVDSGNADSSTESSKDSSSDNDGEVGVKATLAFDDTANRLSQNDDEQIWEDNGVKLINSRHESSQPIKDYSNPIRLYANTSVTIEYAGMTQISFACNDYKAEYPTDLVSSIGEQAGVSVSVKGSVVTVVFATERNSFSFVLLKQVRLNSLTVYTGSACESDSSVVDSSDVTVIPPEIDFGGTLLTLYGLKDGESVTGEFTLTGKIISLDDYNNPTIVVEGFEDMPVYCYKLRLPDASIGDIITVAATTMKNYQGTYEFMNCTLVDNQGGGNGGGSGSGSTEGYTYTEFTTDEKALFNEYFGEVIPFIPNNEYYAEAYTMDYAEEGLTEVGVNFYTFGNTQAEFNAYKAKIEGKYEFYETYEDEYGDTWYSYDAPEYCIDICYYQTDDGYVVDVYAYFYTEYAGGDVDDGGNGGNTTDVDLITNEGKGLPTGENGVYNVDFTKATYAKNVTELGLYQYGCPTQGEPTVLVIPVEFSDVTAESKGYSIDVIKTAFNGGAGEMDYYSVHDYYYISSYGKLDVNFTVLDTWFRPEHDSAYYKNATIDYFGEKIGGGVQLVMDEALAFLSESMDLSVFDSDGNTCIDAVVMINTLEIDGNTDFQWAHRYWNLYTDEEGYYYEYDGVSANDYLWANYQFLFETYDEAGYTIYDETVRNTYTYIHEFGHVLGADDYYDTSYSETELENTPMGGCDVMDLLPGDHNAYTKFNYGWLTNSRLVVAEESVTLTLEDFSKNGDTIIIANNWDETLGVYQEYYIVAYYTMTGLNSNEYRYFSRDGVVVYHVNASLYGSDYGDGTIYYDIYNNNTDPSDSYGTEDNLIEYIKSPADTYTYIEGDSLSSSIKDDQGNQIAYTFTVDALTAENATLTFRKN